MLTLYWRVFAGAVAASAVAGCALIPGLPSHSSDQDLQATVAADHRALEQLTEQNRRLEQQLAELQTGGAQQDHRVFQQLTEQNRHLEQQLREMRTGGAPQGEETGRRLDVMNQRLSKLETASTAVRTTLFRAIARPLTGQPTSEEPLPLPSYNAMLDHEIGIMEGAGRQQVSSQMYRSGLIALRGFRWATAIEEFTQLQKRYPHSEMIERAKYFTAVAYYEDGEYNQSIGAFRDLLRHYPKGRYASTAMLAQAVAYAQLKDRAGARSTLQKLIDNHADSPESAVARDMIKNLKGS